ncbi:1-aminocyclopropane-1-carboxylate deaminase/D-cysteine desulfhydrase [Actinophytocola oryzae]|uniref:1-aminocyclopropane-1-carboxylate deaminase n=1 Tax=Actinophytocola oryzae TaxID=502181 RepID=A0A4R7VXY2_9PSEU|nr:pyridoxal-phosphate dependent enzyme [Actinophytocola oryzae]TDV54852.1 1-aminocyclopropane-1-carboxylate deaminase [Actinophytocola oryzae]
MTSPLVELHDDRLEPHGVRLYLKRDDLLHRDVPGNKWRKLRHNLAAATEQGHTRLLTFGGAYSNHLRAVAAAGRTFGLTTVGVVRGEEHLPLNDSLAFATARGMHLTYLDRATYRRKTEPAVLAALVDEFGPCFVIPEGGANAHGVRGCAELPGELDVDFDVVCVACGTGTTLAGVAAGLRDGGRALGFAVLRGGFLDEDVRLLQERTFGVARTNWSVDHDFHFGGYARRTPELDEFVADFTARHAVVLDRVYEAKMMYGLLSRVRAGAFAEGTRIVAVLG